MANLKKRDIIKTRDIDIRNFLYSIILKEYKNDPGTRIINEFSNGASGYGARIDVAVINESINGYEIKSDRDNLQRLPKQIELYSKAFDKITIISGKVHIDRIMNLVPECWGVIEVLDGKDKIEDFVNIRKAEDNKFIDAYSVSQLLWENEALELLARHNLLKGLSNKTITTLWKEIADNIPLKGIQEFVRLKLKSSFRPLSARFYRRDTPTGIRYDYRCFGVVISEGTEGGYEYWSHCHHREGEA